MAKVRNCVWVSPSSILTIAHNLFRQFLNVTFNKIVCQLVLFLFYETPPPDLLSSLLLVLLAGYFGFQVSARQLSAESVRGARFQAPEQLWKVQSTSVHILWGCEISNSNLCVVLVCTFWSLEGATHGLPMNSLTSLSISWHLNNDILEPPEKYFIKYLFWKFPMIKSILYFAQLHKI